jgi:hypothetical protein
MPTDARIVAVGLFHDRLQARDAIEAPQAASVAATDIGLLMPNPADAPIVAESTEASAKKGATVGAVEGGVFGTLLGWLGPVGAITIPGVGPVIAASVLLTALGGALAGAGLGALAGRLQALGMPHDEAERCEQEVRKGATLVTVRVNDRYPEPLELLRRYGAYDTTTLLASEARAVQQHVSQPMDTEQ